MKPFPDHIFANFENINKAFDSAYSYIIFDSNQNGMSINSFDEIINIVAKNSESGINYKFINNKQHKKKYLVVKMPPNRKDEFLNNILMMSLSKDLNLFMYDPP